MNINAMQLRQIAAICESLTHLEIDSGVYDDNNADATLINTEITVTTRSNALKLGTIKMGTGNGYVFSPMI